MSHIVYHSDDSDFIDTYMKKIDDVSEGEIIEK